jgi:hypothetical protein
MTDWQALAAALNVPVRQDDKAVIETLENLERGFRVLQQEIPFAAPLWSSPSDLE